MEERGNTADTQVNKDIEWESPELHFRVYQMCQKGLTYKRIAEELGVGVSTLGEAVRRFPALRAEIKEGRERSFAKLAKKGEDTLNKLLEGFDYKETTIEQRVVGHDIDGKPIFETKRLIKQKHAGPNVAATIFTLKAKAGYRDKDTPIAKETVKKVDVSAEAKKLEEIPSDTLTIVRRVVNSKDDVEESNKSNKI